MIYPQYRVNPQVTVGKDWLNVQQALLWLKEFYGLRVCFRTFYNWIHTAQKDRRGKPTKLKVKKIDGQWCVKKEWLIDYVESRV